MTLMHASRQGRALVLAVSVLVLALLSGGAAWYVAPHWFTKPPLIPRDQAQLRQGLFYLPNQSMGFTGTLIEQASRVIFYTEVNSGHPVVTKGFYRKNGQQMFERIYPHDATMDDMWVVDRAWYANGAKRSESTKSDGKWTEVFWSQDGRVVSTNPPIDEDGNPLTR